MKKFLSLLLAMTMVMSLIVLPARATGDTLQDGITIASSSTTAKVGDTVAFSVPATATVTPGSDTPEASQNVITATLKSCVWNVTGGSEVASSTGAAYEVRANAAGTIHVTCTATYQYGEDNKILNTSALTKDVTVTSFNYTDITLKIYGKTYTPASSVDVNLVRDAQITLDNIEVGNASGSPFTLGAVRYASNTNTITVPATREGVDSITALTIHLNITQKDASNIIKTSPESASKTIRSGQTLAFTSTYTGGDAPVSYAWADGASAANFTGGTTKSATWTAPNVTKETKYKISCTATEAGQAKKSNEIEVTVQPETNIFVPSVPSAMSRGGQQTLSFRFYDSSTNQEITLTSENNVMWSIESSGLPTASYLKVTNATGASAFKSATLTIPTSYTASSCKVKVTFTYSNKNYSYTYNISLSSLTAAISPIQNNTPVTLYGGGYNYGYITTNNLVVLAQAALTSAHINATASYVTLDTITGSRTNCYIQQTSSTSGYYTYTITGTSIGTASFTGTVYTTNSGNYPITFTATVTPIATTYEAQYPEPVASYGNTYKYYVQVPAGASYYYVVGTPNQAITPTDFSQSGKTVYYTTTQSTSLYALTDANFVNGQCTLWIVTKNSSDNKLYYGQLTVYQKNHDIKYNGVVGNTVQFKHNDFTTFMNEMYGTNTTSYLTFNSVKFTSVPNATTQGTLYYNGVAMTTGYGSNYFNTSTAVTNLDNVSFSVSSRVPSTTKEIRIPFTLYATRYNSYGTSAGTSVTYSGVVVISLVREDVTFTVAPGDSVRFTDSAFLTYLRSASGINYNYNIDYVTFDQSAVNALNEGVLYAYSTGFNAVKTTDRFYYTTTSYNQNALSDVTFRASTYAKTGTTAYIPFTIYAKYGTSSATRQVTGTVAIKIAQTMNFVDVKTSDYFYDSVKWAVNDNITKGTSATTFSPNNTCTRAEIVTFLWRAAGSPTPTITRNPFTDVKYSVGSDFYNAILWASQNGIAAGTSTTTFAPNDNCTRAQIVTFLWRYAKKPLGYYTNPFNDVNKTEYAAYYDAILWAAGKGIATGNTPKTFNPDGTCTRAEAVTFLYRYESTK